MSYAADTLLYYIKTLWEQADLRWNSDNQAEVKSIVESIESTIENQIKQKLESVSAPKVEQAKRESQEYVEMFAEHQKKQLRLSVATPCLTALIQADAMEIASAIVIAVNAPDPLAAAQEVLNNRKTQAQIVLEALSYADLLFEEAYKEQQ